jgi:hypothetical protein
MNSWTIDDAMDASAKLGDVEIEEQS